MRQVQRWDAMTKLAILVVVNGVAALCLLGASSICKAREIKSAETLAGQDEHCGQPGPARRAPRGSSRLL